jgi:hypothetical protein
MVKDLHTLYKLERSNRYTKLFPIVDVLEGIIKG